MSFNYSHSINLPPECLSILVHLKTSKRGIMNSLLQCPDRRPVSRRISTSRSQAPLINRQSYQVYFPFSSRSPHTPKQRPNNSPICKEEWPSKEQESYYTTTLLITQFVIPLLVLIYTYTRIAIVVWGKRPPGEAENSRDQRMAKSKRKVRALGNFSDNINFHLL